MAKQYTILLVEDEPEIARIFSMILKEAGFKVIITDSGKTTLEAVSKNIPDLVLLDLVIPDMDGYQVLKKIKSNQKLKAVPVYVFSNLTQDHEAERAKKIGANDYLIKSDYTPKQLVIKVKSILKISE